MKNMSMKSVILFAVAMITMVACKKEDVQKAVDSYEVEMTALVDQTDNDAAYQTEPADDANGTMTAMNEGIAADFLVEGSDIDEVEGPAGVDSARSHIRNHSFAACLRRLDLSERQREAIKKALGAYEDCRHLSIKRARAIHAEMQAANKAKAERLIAAYKAGNISKEKFEAAMKELRQNFAKELRSKQIQEKLDMALKNCYRKYLGNLKDILTEKQWAAFVRCHKR
jgi:hypothetical protein